VTETTKLFGIIQTEEHKEQEQQKPQ